MHSFEKSKRENGERHDERPAHDSCGQPPNLTCTRPLRMGENERVSEGDGFEGQHLETVTFS